MQRQEMLDYLQDFLAVDSYKDYAPNGLQVEGTPEINKIIFGVTASQALIDKAIELQADAILVHHGYFWRSEKPEITGMKYQRIKKLIDNKINLLAYHLPLDGHPELGNNAQLGKLLGILDATPTYAAEGLVRLGNLSKPMPIADFIELVANKLERQPLHLKGGKDLVETIAWCSGAAQGYIEQAMEWGADLYFSGEVSEQTTHQALEGGIHYLAAGHHATETLGVKALAEHLQDKFAVECIFVDCPNPV